MFSVHEDKALDTRFGSTLQIAHPMSMVAVRTTCRTRDLFVVFIPRQIVGASRLSFQRWFFFGWIFQLWPRLFSTCSIRLGPGIRPRFWTVSASACPIKLLWVQSLTFINLRIKHQLLLWPFPGPSEPNLWTTEGHTWIPGVLGAVQDQQHSGSLSYETPWDCGRPTWRSGSGPLRESPSRAAESKAMLCLWTPEAGHLKE